MKRSPIISQSSQAYGASYHLQDAAIILADLKTSATLGLSSAAAAENQLKYGKNVLEEIQPRAAIIVFLSYFWSIPVALLTLAALLSLATDSQVDAIVIMGVVIINAILGYLTESKSERIILALKNLVSPSATVIRDGQSQEIDAAAVVIGDILMLKPGSFVAADARLIQDERLTIDESALTGESIPILKNNHTLMATDIPLAERSNMVYRGTLVTGGQGLGVVTAIGKQTEMGCIQALVGETTIPQTPLSKQLDRAGGQLVLLSSAVCIVVFGLGIVRGYDLIEMLKTSIALAVAAVPEGLPTVATITLALGINTMRDQGVLVRRLDAIEALGSVQTICFDKTGTLTTNKMSAIEIQTANHRIEIPTQQIITQDNPELWQLLKVSILCNETSIEHNQDGTLQLMGSPTEIALMEMAIALGADISTVRNCYPQIAINHRSDGQNYMMTVHQMAKSQRLIALKGNPLEVLQMCNYQLQDHSLTVLTDIAKSQIKNTNQTMTSKALRVLGIAYAEIDATTEIALENLIWLGLIGLINPIRPGVKELIAAFHQAGINTVMVTGDQANTAKAIAQQLDLNQGQELNLIAQGELLNSQTQLNQVNVFARISPGDKLKIVRTFQQAGEVVAMTGDGINDAPALKAAEIGIAMGKIGTDIAREVADIILEDDNLGTAIAAVSQGRTIYHNIKKALHFLLSTNLSEIMVMVIANLCGIGQPLNAIQLLWLNLVTDIFPGLALGLEAPEPNVLKLPPRSPETPIIDRQEFKILSFEAMIISLFTLIAYGYAIANYGIGDRASTIAFMSLVTAQLLHAFSCRSSQPLWQVKLQPNHYLSLALVISLGLQFFCLIVPYWGHLLGVTVINGLDLIVIGISAFLSLMINEIKKVIVIC